MSTLLVQVSGHGLGHWGQTVPVLQALTSLRPDLRVVIRSAVPAAAIRRRFPGVAQVIHCESDRGLVMRSAVEVLVEHSHAMYAAEQAQWDRLVDEDCRLIRTLAPDLILSNVGYRVLAAAHRLGIPSIAMSSLNWAAVYWCYAALMDGAAAVREQMMQCYAQALHFIRLTPGIEMPDLPNVLDVGPVASTANGDGVREALGCPNDVKLVLAAIGGIPTDIDVDIWPRLDGCAWLFPPELACRFANAIAWDPGLSFEKAIAASDVVVTKVGYGTMSEAAAQGIRILYAARPDWPEDRPLSRWLDDHAQTERISWESLLTGQFSAPLQALLARPARAPVMPTGNGQAAAIIARYL